MREIYLAGGCFWGTEHFLRRLAGVGDTEVGYANSQKPEPTYQEVCSGVTDAVETVRVEYDPAMISLPFLLSNFFMTIDPTSIDQQGGDRGRQYRTGIYYTEGEDAEVIQGALQELQKKYTQPVVVECLPLANFYPAEPEHQDYLITHRGGYCHIPQELFRLASEAKDPSRLEVRN